MHTATIPLTDLITDDGVPIDLSAMSEAEAIARIKTLYDFLSPAVEVEIRNGMALMTAPPICTSSSATSTCSWRWAGRAIRRTALVPS